MGGFAAPDAVNKIVFAAKIFQDYPLTTPINTVYLKHTARISFQAFVPEIVMPQGTAAQQSETLVGCNSLVSVAAQLPVTVAKSQMNRSYVLAMPILGRISVGGFRDRGVKGSAGNNTRYTKIGIGWR